MLTPRRCSSLFCSFGDVFTSLRLILRLQGATSQTPTAKDAGSRDGSGDGRRPGWRSLEPTSGKRMELKSQWEEPEAGEGSDWPP